MAYIDFNSRKKLKIWNGVEGPVYHSEKMTIGHFTIEEGTFVPQHHHPHEQWTNVIEGELEFDMAGEKMLMKAGMSAYIPSGIPHSVKALTRCKVIDCFTPPREDFIELEMNNGKEEA